MRLVLTMNIEATFLPAFSTFVVNGQTTGCSRVTLTASASLFTPAAGIGSLWNSSSSCSLTMSCPLVFKKAPTCTCWRKGF